MPKQGTARRMRELDVSSISSPTRWQEKSTCKLLRDETDLYIRRAGAPGNQTNRTLR
jgi:hypothetical protein